LKHRRSSSPSGILWGVGKSAVRPRRGTTVLVALQWRGPGGHEHKSSRAEPASVRAWHWARAIVTLPGGGRSLSPEGLARGQPAARSDVAFAERPSTARS